MNYLIAQVLPIEFLGPEEHAHNVKMHDKHNIHESLKARPVFIFLYFIFFEQLKFHALLS